MAVECAADNVMSKVLISELTKTYPGALPGLRKMGRTARALKQEQPHKEWGTLGTKEMRQAKAAIHAARQEAAAVEFVKLMAAGPAEKRKGQASEEYSAMLAPGEMWADGILRNVDGSAYILDHDENIKSATIHYLESLGIASLRLENDFTAPFTFYKNKVVRFNHLFFQAMQNSSGDVLLLIRNLYLNDIKSASIVMNTLLQGRSKSQKRPIINKFKREAKKVLDGPKPLFPRLIDFLVEMAYNIDASAVHIIDTKRIRNLESRRITLNDQKRQLTQSLQQTTAEILRLTEILKKDKAAHTALQNKILVRQGIQPSSDDSERKQAVQQLLQSRENGILTSDECQQTVEAMVGVIQLVRDALQMRNDETLSEDDRLIVNEIVNNLNEAIRTFNDISFWTQDEFDEYSDLLSDYLAIIDDIFPDLKGYTSTIKFDLAKLDICVDSNLLQLYDNILRASALGSHAASEWLGQLYAKSQQFATYRQNASRHNKKLTQQVQELTKQLRQRDINDIKTANNVQDLESRLFRLEKRLRELQLEGDYTRSAVTDSLLLQDRVTQAAESIRRELLEKNATLNQQAQTIAVQKEKLRVLNQAFKKAQEALQTYQGIIEESTQEGLRLEKEKIGLSEKLQRLEQEVPTGRQGFEEEIASLKQQLEEASALQTKREEEIIKDTERALENYKQETNALKEQVASFEEESLKAEKQRNEAAIQHDDAIEKLKTEKNEAIKGLQNLYEKSEKEKERLADALERQHEQTTEIEQRLKKEKAELIDEKRNNLALITELEDTNKSLRERLESREIEAVTEEKETIEGDASDAGNLSFESTTDPNRRTPAAADLIRAEQALFELESENANLRAEYEDSARRLHDTIENQKRQLAEQQDKLLDIKSKYLDIAQAVHSDYLTEQLFDKDEEEFVEQLKHEIEYNEQLASGAQLSIEQLEEEKINLQDQLERERENSDRVQQVLDIVQADIDDIEQTLGDYNITSTSSPELGERFKALPEKMSKALQLRGLSWKSTRHRRPSSRSFMFAPKMTSNLSLFSPIDFEQGENRNQLWQTTLFCTCRYVAMAHVMVTRVVYESLAEDRAAKIAAITMGQTPNKAWNWLGYLAQHNDAFKDIIKQEVGNQSLDYIDAQSVWAELSSVNNPFQLFVLALWEKITSLTRVAARLSRYDITQIFKDHVDRINTLTKRCKAIARSRFNIYKNVKSIGRVDARVVNTDTATRVGTVDDVADVSSGIPSEMSTVNQSRTFVNSMPFTKLRSEKWKTMYECMISVDNTTFSVVKTVPYITVPTSQEDIIQYAGENRDVYVYRTKFGANTFYQANVPLEKVNLKSLTEATFTVEGSNDRKYYQSYSLKKNKSSAETTAIASDLKSFIRKLNKEKKILKDNAMKLHEIDTKESTMARKMSAVVEEDNQRVPSPPREIGGWTVADRSIPDISDERKKQYTALVLKEGEKWVGTGSAANYGSEASARRGASISLALSQADDLGNNARKILSASMSSANKISKSEIEKVFPENAHVGTIIQNAGTSDITYEGDLTSSQMDKNDKIEAMRAFSTMVGLELSVSRPCGIASALAASIVFPLKVPTDYQVAKDGAVRIFLRGNSFIFVPLDDSDTLQNVAGKIQAMISNLKADEWVFSTQTEDGTIESYKASQGHRQTSAAILKDKRQVYVDMRASQWCIGASDHISEDGAVEDMARYLLAINGMPSVEQLVRLAEAVDKQYLKPRCAYKVLRAAQSLLKVQPTDEEVRRITNVDASGALAWEYEDATTITSCIPVVAALSEFTKEDRRNEDSLVFTSPQGQPVSFGTPSNYKDVLEKQGGGGGAKGAFDQSTFLSSVFTTPEGESPDSRRSTLSDPSLSFDVGNFTESSTPQAGSVSRLETIDTRPSGAFSLEDVTRSPGAFSLGENESFVDNLNAGSGQSEEFVSANEKEFRPSTVTPKEKEFRPSFVTPKEKENQPFFLQLPRDNNPKLATEVTEVTPGPTETAKKKRLVQVRKEFAEKDRLRAQQYRQELKRAQELNKAQQKELKGIVKAQLSDLENKKGDTTTIRESIDILNSTLSNLEEEGAEIERRTETIEAGDLTPLAKPVRSIAPRTLTRGRLKPNLVEGGVGKQNFPETPGFDRLRARFLLDEAKKFRSNLDKPSEKSPDSSLDSIEREIRTPLSPQPDTSRSSSTLNTGGSLQSESPFSPGPSEGEFIPLRPPPLSSKKESGSPLSVDTSPLKTYPSSASQMTFTIL